MAEGKLLLATKILRGLSGVSFLVAAVVMFLSTQKIDEEYLKLIVRYIDWKGFLFAFTVNCIGCVYNFIIVLAIPRHSLLWKTIVVIDVIVNIVVCTSLGAGWQTYLLINEGNIQTRWSPVCCVVPYFCNKILGSLVTSSVGFACSFSLLMWTLHECVDPLLLGINNK